MMGQTAKDISYCYLDVHGNRKIKIISDERGGGIGYRVEDGVLRVWMNSDKLNKTTIIPIHRVEYVEEIERQID